MTLENQQLHLDNELLRVELASLRTACSRENEEISQALGRALGYPRFCDDQKNFPEATEADGVCVGDHVAATLAMEAAGRIGTLVAEVAKLRSALGSIQKATTDIPLNHVYVALKFIQDKAAEALATAGEGKDQA